jgi:hypothetical protein
MRDRSRPPANPGRRHIVFIATTVGDPVANAIVLPAGGSDGDPTPGGAVGGGAVLEIYDAAGSGEKAVIDLPASGWSSSGDPSSPTVYRYVATSRGDPIQLIVLRANRLRLRGGGASWPYTLDEPSQGRIAISLRLGTAIPWCASIPARSGGNPPSTAYYDHVDRFVGARRTPPPASCPPLP